MSSHHTLIYIYSPNSNLALPPPSQHVFHETASDRVMLATAMQSVQRKCGELVLVRAFLDSGSQENFVTDELA